MGMLQWLNPAPRTHIPPIFFTLLSSLYQSDLVNFIGLIVT